MRQWRRVQLPCCVSSSNMGISIFRCDTRRLGHCECQHIVTEIITKRCVTVNALDFWDVKRLNTPPMTQEKIKLLHLLTERHSLCQLRRISPSNHLQLKLTDLYSCVLALIFIIICIHIVVYYLDWRLLVVHSRLTLTYTLQWPAAYNQIFVPYDDVARYVE